MGGLFKPGLPVGKISKDNINEIKNSELIVYTSGRGGLFKPGLPIGKIYRENYKRVTFFSDFKQLEYVKIISHSIEGNN